LQDEGCKKKKCAGGASPHIKKGKKGKVIFHMKVALRVRLVVRREGGGD